MGKNAAKARNNDKRAAKYHDRLAAEAIRYGPIHEERSAQAQKIDAHRQTTSAGAAPRSAPVADRLGRIMSMPKVGREDRRPSSNVNTNESGRMRTVRARFQSASRLPPLAP